MHFCMCGMKQSKNQASDASKKIKRANGVLSFLFSLLGNLVGYPRGICIKNARHTKTAVCCDFMELRRVCSLFLHN